MYSGNVGMKFYLEENKPSKMAGDNIVFTKDSTESTAYNMYMTDPGGNVLPVQDKVARQQINVLSEKTHFNLIASVGYTIVSQNCYIQDGRTYVQAVFKRTDEEVFGTGALYIASSNILPEGTYACNAICFFALPMNGIINDFIQISVRGKNISVMNSLTNLKVVSFTCVCC